MQGNRVGNFPLQRGSPLTEKLNILDLSQKSKSYLIDGKGLFTEGENESNKNLASKRNLRLLIPTNTS